MVQSGRHRALSGKGEGRGGGYVTDYTKEIPLPFLFPDFVTGKQ